jgi:hypothetical protein
MISIGVPKATVMAIANQNPDDLETFYDLAQKAKAQGVPLDNPEIYEGLIQIDGEFNPGNENVTSLLGRIFDPLAANAKADPEGWDFDPKGTIWSTMLGYNAMDRARAKLGNTEVMPGVSAADVLASSEDNAYSHPLGDATVTLNAGRMGDLTREAAERNRGGSDVSVGERSTILSNFEKQVEKELLGDTLSGLEGPEKEAEARKRAAGAVIKTFPEAAGIPEITQYIGQEEEADAPVAPIAPTTPVAPTAPVEAPTAPAPEGATQTPASASTLPKQLPSGSTFVRDNGDGTSTYRRPDGVERTYDNNDVIKLTSGPLKQAKPTPGYLDRMGSEYD